MNLHSVDDKFYDYSSQTLSSFQLNETKDIVYKKIKELNWNYGISNSAKTLNIETYGKNFPKKSSHYGDCK
jgi:hypothetical protein